MKIFQSLTTIKKLYGQSGVRALFRGLYKQSERRLRIVVWGVTLLYAGLPIALTEALNSSMSYGVACGVVFCVALLCFFVMEWALSRHFREEYAVYAIAGNRLSQSRLLLHYALFARHLEDSQLSTEDLRKASKRIKFDESRNTQESFLRQPLITPTLTVLGVLSVEVMKNTGVWEHGQVIKWLIMVVALLLIAFGVFGFLRRGRDSDARLDQFVTWYLESKDGANEAGSV